MPNNSMERLREIRDAQQAARDLNEERDGLILEAAGSYSVRAIAKATGLSKTRVHAILRVTGK